MEKTEKKVFTVSFERNKKQRHINIIGKDEEEAKSNFWNIIKKILRGNKLLHRRY